MGAPRRKGTAFPHIVAAEPLLADISAKASLLFQTMPNEAGARSAGYNTNRAQALTGCHSWPHARNPAEGFNSRCATWCLSPWLVRWVWLFSRNEHLVGKALGPDATEIASQIVEFDPDESWIEVKR